MKREKLKIWGNLLKFGFIMVDMLSQISWDLTSMFSLMASGKKAKSTWADCLVRIPVFLFLREWKVCHESKQLVSLNFDLTFVSINCCKKRKISEVVGFIILCHCSLYDKHFICWKVDYTFTVQPMWTLFFSLTSWWIHFRKSNLYFSHF